MPVPGPRFQPTDQQPDDPLEAERTAVMVDRVNGGYIKVLSGFGAPDPDPFAPAEQPELTWTVALSEPIVRWDSVQNVRLTREESAERIALLESKRTELEQVLPIFKEQLAEVTAVTEANERRLTDAWAAVNEVVAEGERLSAQVSDFSAPRVAESPFRVRDLSATVYVMHRRSALGDTREWRQHQELKRRMFDDAKSPEYQAIRRRSFLQGQVSGIPHWLALIDGRIRELHDNVRILGDVDERADPDSAWSVRRRQRHEDLEAQVSAGTIGGYQILS